MIDLRSLEVFFWVVRLGGFGRAAARLHTTQPAVSQRIAQLEAQFGTRLLERERHRAPVPTAKGLELLAHAERLLAQADALEAAMADPRALGGRVRLGTSETIVHTWLHRLVQRLGQDHPRVELEITVDISARLRAALLAGELDAALLLGPLAAPRLVARPLSRYAMGFAARPDLPLPGGALRLADLVAWPLLTYSRETAPHAALAALCEAEGLAARLFGNSSLASILRLAQDGLGIAVVPDAVMAPEVAAGRLRRLKVETALPPLDFVVAHAAGPGQALAAAVARLAVEVAASESPSPPDNAAVSKPARAGGAK